MKSSVWMGITLFSIHMGILSQENQQDSLQVQHLDEVILSDTRFPITREQSGKNVILLSSEKLKSFTGMSVAQVLSNQAGLEIAGSRSRPGEVLGVFARGGRGRQVLVRIDGHRVSDPSSSSQEYDLRFLNLNEIESIEIIKGASSTLYGTNAAAAVINITTKRRSENPISGAFSSTYGTDNSVDDSSADLGKFMHSARLSGTLEKLDYSASLHHRYANGLSSLTTLGNEKDPFSSTSIQASVGYRFSELTQLRIFGNQTQNTTEYDNSAIMVDAAYRITSNQDRTGLEFRTELGSTQVELNAAYASYQTEDFSDFPATYTGRNWVGDLLVKTSISTQFRFLAGLNVNRDIAVLSEDRAFTMVDPYLNFTWFHPSGFHFNSGIRLNNHSEYGLQEIYQINPSYRFELGKGIFKLMGTYATAYITPSLNQLFGAFGANPELSPEDNRTLEAGLSYEAPDLWNLTVLYFERREDNAVLFNNADFQYFNSPSSIAVNGLEVEGSWKVAEGHRLSTNYTWINRQGDAAIRIPAHKFNLQWKGLLFSKIGYALFYGYTSSRYDTNFTNFENVVLDAYSLVGGHLSAKVIPGKLDVNFQVSNLFNTKYTEIFGVQTPGRNMALGFELNL